MKIGILGTGNIGKTLILKLSKAGHIVKVANSRGPETIDKALVVNGAQLVTTNEALKDVQVVILSIPLNRLKEVAPLIKDLPNDVVLIDTSNYYPLRDGVIDALESGTVESLWVSEVLGRKIFKAWNSIGSDSFARKGLAKGDSERIAISVAGDDETGKKIAMSLVEDTGFNAVDSGPLSESWRQQPGAPAYCTDLKSEEIPAALAAAEKARLPKRRDLAVEAIMERVGDGKTNPSAEYGVQLCRVLYM